MTASARPGQAFRMAMVVLAAVLLPGALAPTGRAWAPVPASTRDFAVAADAARAAAAALAAVAAWADAPAWADDAPTAKAPGDGADQAPKAGETGGELGPVKARVRIEPANPRIGDAVTLTLEVTAADGIELRMPEFGQSLERFPVREFVPRESVDAAGNTVVVQRYVLEPPLSGPQAIPPLLVEFVDHRPGERPAPEGEDSYELVTPRLPFEVASATEGNSVDRLHPPRGRLGKLAEPGAWQRWALALLLLALLALPFAWRRLGARRAAERRRSAWEVARARLDALSATGRPEGADAVDAFFVELSALMRRYLEDRFELRAPELTTEEFLQAASATPDLGEAQKGFLRDFLRRADMVKFARFVPSSPEMDEALREASRFLDETRNSAMPEGGAHGRV